VIRIAAGTGAFVAREQKELAMRTKRSASQKSAPQLELDDGGRIARRRTEFLPDGAYLFEDELEVPGELTAKVITCEAWLVELYELRAGELSFLSGASTIRPATNCFGVLYPPFTISALRFVNTRGHLVGVAANLYLPAEFRSVPLMFETGFKTPPGGVAEVIEILEAGTSRQTVEFNPRASLLSLKAKKMIDENYLVQPSIARISRRLNVTHEHLSRQFKRDFGMSPSAYLHRLRLADAPLRLAQGEEIINVSASVGYNDLSRFYKQFQKRTRTSPGACRTMIRPRRG